MDVNIRTPHEFEAIVLKNFLRENAVSHVNFSNLMNETLGQMLLLRSEALKNGNVEFFWKSKIRPKNDFKLISSFFLKTLGMEVVKEKMVNCKIMDFGSAPGNPHLLEANKYLTKCINVPSLKTFTTLSELEAVMHEVNPKIDDECFIRVHKAVGKVLGEFSLGVQPNGLPALNNFFVTIEPNDRYYFENILKKLSISIKSEGCIMERINYTLKGNVAAPGFAAFNLKPVFKLPKMIPLKIDEDQYSDISFNIEGKNIKAHKLMLLNCPYFQAMLNGDWKENQTGQAIDFSLGTHRAFLEVKKYLYNMPLSNTFQLDASLAVEVYQLAHILQITQLEESALSNISNSINAQSFLDVVMCAEVMKDDQLRMLCVWFAKQPELYAQDFDFSDFSTLDLFHLKTVISSYDIKIIEKIINGEFKNKFAIDEAFIELCNYICINKDSKLKLELISILKEREELLNQLLDNIETLPEHWKAYIKVVSDVRI